MVVNEEREDVEGSKVMVELGLNIDDGLWSMEVYGLWF